MILYCLPLQKCANIISHVTPLCVAFTAEYSMQAAIMIKYCTTQSSRVEAI